MINKFILLLSLMMCTYGFSQTIDYNTKNGYAVQGYDVVSYFDKTPSLANLDLLVPSRSQLPVVRANT